MCWSIRLGIRSPDLFEMRESIGSHLSEVETPGVADPSRDTAIDLDANFRRKVVFRFTPNDAHEHPATIPRSDLIDRELNPKNVSPATVCFLARIARQRFDSGQR